jgi:hypothetical protein
MAVNAYDPTPDILSSSSSTLRHAAPPPPTCEQGDRDDIPRCLGEGLNRHVALIIGNIIRGALLGGLIGAIGGPAGAGIGAQIGGTIGAGFGIVALQEWAWREFSAPARRLIEHFQSSFAGPNVRIGGTATFQLAGDYRVLNEADLSGGFSVMATIGSALAKLRDAVAKAGKTDSTPFSLSGIGQGRTAVGTTRYLRVEPPTQSAGGITVTASLSGNTVSVSASGQGGTQQFSFELVYENPDIALDRTPFTVTVLGSCGDGVAQAGEACDGNDLAGHACAAGGYMYCDADCTLVDKCQAGTCTNGMAGYFPGPYQFNYCPNDPGYAAAGVYNSCCDQGCGSGGTCPWAYHCYNPNFEHPCYGSCPSVGPVVWFCVNGDSCAGDGCNAINGGAHCTGNNPFYYSVKSLTCPQ